MKTGEHSLEKFYDHGSLVFQTTAICHCLLLPCRVCGQLAEWIVLIHEPM